MIFPQVPLTTQTITLTEDTGPSGRWYVTPNGNRYPSVTTMLGATSDKEKAEGLRAWRERVGEAEAAAITARAAGEGTRLHSTLEKIITNQWTPFQQSQLLPNIKSLLNQMVPVLESHVTAIHGSELALYDDGIRLAGRTDCLCSWDGVYTILDFKRSNKPKTEDMIEDYFLQTTAYALMAESHIGIEIPTVTIVMGVANGSGPLVWHLEKDKYISRLVERIARYYNVTL